MEAAHNYRVELGTVDERTGELALRSARHYAESARRALDRDELVSAGTQAARGAAVAAADEALHAELLLIGCEAYLSAGDVAAGAPLVDDLDRIADESLAPWATCYRCQFVVYTEPERLPEVDERLQGAIDEFSRRKDPAGLAKAHRVRASARSRLGRIGDCEADLFEALIAARQSGDHRQITAALGAAPGAALWGPSPVPKAGGRCLDVVRMQRMTTAAPSLEATSLRHLAVLELLRGRPDKARKMLADARQVVADLGLRHGLMETELFAGLIESMEGDPVAAEPHFRTALEGFKTLGVGADAGQAAALLARTVLVQGRVDEADAYAAESERLAGRNLKTAIAWRAVRAEILAARGQFDEAVALARDAVTVAAGTDLVLDHADACLALRRVLEAAGDLQGANSARSAAEALYIAKEVAARISPASARNVPTAPPSIPVAKEALPSLPSRMYVANRATTVGRVVLDALRARDVDAAIAAYAENFEYDDRRRWSGDPIGDLADGRAAIERILQQYSHFTETILAVRGERLVLASARWSDDSGNEATDLIVIEINNSGRIVYEGRFDDDFEAAYRELDRRYYAGEGAAFAEAGTLSTESIIALNNRDYDRLLGELSATDLRVENRTRSAFPDRSAEDLRASFGELNTMVATSRTWLSVIHWLSPRWSVSRLDRDAVGDDGEQYRWTRLLVIEIRDGRLASMCQFEPDDEAAAFAYAEEQVRATSSRLAVRNLASDTFDVVSRAIRNHDADSAVRVYSENFVYDDHQRLSGGPVVGVDAMRTGIAFAYDQYSHIEWRTLAVRGELLELRWARQWDDAGNETSGLMVIEVDPEGWIVYQGRFDEDHFDSAYRELERRYYAGEGAEFGESGATATNWTLALNRADFDTIFDDLTTSDFCISNRSRSAFPDRTATEYRSTLEELVARVASARAWVSTARWLSLNWCVARVERQAVGEDGERYTWQFLLVLELRGARVASMCEFELDDEEGAFAYAQARMPKVGNRLEVANAASEVTEAVLRALNAHDSDAHVAQYAELFTYDDRRRLAGDPIEDIAAMRRAGERIFKQYSTFGFRTLAVRGERLVMTRSRWSDVSGNETTYLHVTEIDETRRVVYDGRFDEDDFDSAYRELERRYYTGEGAAFAENGLPATEIPRAMANDDFDRLFNALCSPDLVVETRSGRAFPDRSAAELRLGFEELNILVASKRIWTSVIAWPSPTSSIVRLEREAVGPDGQKYQWVMLLAAEYADGRVNHICEFDPDDEESAFAYVEERLEAHTSRLAVSNQASGTISGFLDMMRANDVDGAIAYYPEQFVYDDHRRLSGDPVVGREAMREGIARHIAQYTHYEFRTLAVRGQRLQLISSVASDADGNSSTGFTVFEADDGLITYHGRFDEDDFDSAYRELERRYYTGEGADFAEAGTMATEYTITANQGNLDRMLGELSTPDLFVENRSRSGFPDRSIADFRASMDQLNDMVASVRTWNSVICWLSPMSCVSRLEREAIGRDGERFTWTRVVASEIRDGRVASMCGFELEDEEAAFTFAEERMHAVGSRVAVTNRSVQSSERLGAAMNAGDIDVIMGCYSDHLVYDDRRRLTGDPISGRAEFRAAFERILAQYSHFERRVLAVRGERLNLHWGRWSDDSGNETAYLHVYEMDDDGRQIYEGRFDEDNFEDAYRELEMRYAAGEGAAFAMSIGVSTDWITALNRGEFDRTLRELSVPDVRFETRSRSAFPRRSFADLSASLQELGAMVTSVRTWNSAVHWLSPQCAVVRMQREALGPDGEHYEWTRLYVTEINSGLLASLCEFELEDEAAAFAYAEERIRVSTSRLAVTNRSCDSVQKLAKAMDAHDIDTLLELVSGDYSYIDHRRLSGNPIRVRAELVAALERLFQHYNHFDFRPLAVRGERLSLHKSSWSDDAGNVSSYLHVFDLDKDGQPAYEARFDEDDFEGAYRELDRRYYAGEGAAFAQPGAMVTDYLMAYNHGDFDEFLSYLTNPEMRFENRSRSVFPDRSVSEFRTSIEELAEMVDSTLAWYSTIVWISPNCCVSRFERLSIGGDGEQYSWTRIYISEFQDGRATASCQFDPEDEDAAFAYAEERVRQAEQR